MTLMTVYWEYKYKIKPLPGNVFVGTSYNSGILKKQNTQRGSIPHPHAVAYLGFWGRWENNHNGRP